MFVVFINKRNHEQRISEKHDSASCSCNESRLHFDRLTYRGSFIQEVPLRLDYQLSDRLNRVEYLIWI